jgi:hypothetical protein
MHMYPRLAPSGIARMLALLLCGQLVSILATTLRAACVNTGSLMSCSHTWRTHKQASQYCVERKGNKAFLQFRNFALYSA